MLGVLVGAIIGSRLLVNRKNKEPQTYFCKVTIAVLGCQMLYKGFWGKI